MINDEGCGCVDCVSERLDQEERVEKEMTYGEEKCLSLVAGALLDFAGYLTGLPEDESFTVGARHECTVAVVVHHLEKWAARRGGGYHWLDDADVENWHRIIKKHAEMKKAHEEGVSKESRESLHRGIRDIQEGWVSPFDPEEYWPGKIMSDKASAKRGCVRGGKKNGR